MTLERHEVQSRVATGTLYRALAVVATVALVVTAVLQVAILNEQRRQTNGPIGKAASTSGSSSSTTVKVPKSGPTVAPSNGGTAEIDVFNAAIAENSDPLKVFEALLLSISSQERTDAERAANAAGLSSEHWPEFSKASNLSLSNFASALDAQLQDQHLWLNALVALSKAGASQAVVEMFARGGPSMLGVVDQIVKDPNSRDAKRALILLEEAGRKSTVEYAASFAKALSR